MCGDDPRPFWFRAERTAEGHALRLEHDPEHTSEETSIVVPLSRELGATRSHRLAASLNARLGLKTPSRVT